MANVRFIDLFAGVGGMRIAAEDLGANCVFTSEIDKSARETYASNFGIGEDEIFGDITRVRRNTVPDHDLLLAGFPCQPFSNAGKRQGFRDATRGTLFFHIAEIVSEKRPKAVLLENVRGLLSQDAGRTYRTITESLSELGYIVHGKLLNARDFGLPQNRVRLFIVALRDDCEGAHNFEFPAPTHSRDSLRLGAILEDDPDPSLFISDRIWESHKLRKQRNREMGRGFGFQIFNRDSLYSATISARYPKDGSEILIDEQDGRNPRKLSAREAFKLQGFPDWFTPNRSYTQATKQAGNSVPVPVVRSVIDQMLVFL